MPHSAEPIRVTAQTRLPAYIIQPLHGGERPAGIPILLGDQLVTTSLTIGNEVPGRRGARRLRVKCDHPIGAGLDKLMADSRHDIAGCIGGMGNLSESLIVGANDFLCRVNSDGSDLVSLDQMKAECPSLVLSRKDMFSLGLGDAFRRSEVNPHFGSVMKIPQDFDQLVVMVRARIEAACYRIL